MVGKTAEVADRGGGRGGGYGGGYGGGSRSSFRSFLVANLRQRPRPALPCSRPAGKAKARDDSGHDGYSMHANDDDGSYGYHFRGEKSYTETFVRHLAKSKGAPMCARLCIPGFEL